MKTSPLLSLFACALLAAAPVLRAAEGAESPLDKTMSGMNSAFKSLRNQVGDAGQKESALRQVATLIDGAKKSLNFKPARIAEMPVDAQAKAMADYQAAMNKFIEALTKLEAAIKADKLDEAKEIYASLTAMKNDGHKKFKKPSPPKK